MIRLTSRSLSFSTFLATRLMLFFLLVNAALLFGVHVTGALVAGFQNLAQAAAGFHRVLCLPVAVSLFACYSHCLHFLCQFWFVP